MVIHTSHLTHYPPLPDTLHVPEKEGAGFSSLKVQKRTNGAMPFFYVRMPLIVLYGRQWRGSLRACWFPFVHQSANPVICRPPHLAVGHGLTAQKDHIMSGTTTPTQSKIITRLTAKPAFTPTPEEIKLILAYRAIDDKTQLCIDNFIASCTKDVQFLRRIKPTLKLVSGSAT